MFASEATLVAPSILAAPIVHDGCVFPEGKFRGLKLLFDIYIGSAPLLCPFEVHGIVGRVEVGTAIGLDALLLLLFVAPLLLLAQQVIQQIVELILLGRFA